MGREKWCRGLLGTEGKSTGEHDAFTQLEVDQTVEDWQTVFKALLWMPSVQRLVQRAVALVAGGTRIVWTLTPKQAEKAPTFYSEVLLCSIVCFKRKSISVREILLISERLHRTFFRGLTGREYPKQKPRPTSYTKSK